MAEDAAGDPSAGHLDVTLAVRFDRATADSLRSMARRRGIGPTTLIRMWILERMVREMEALLPRDP